MSRIVTIVHSEADQPDQLLLPSKVLVGTTPLKETMREEGVPPERVVHGQAKDWTTWVCHQEVVTTNVFRGIHDL